jgi:hypothetical protein
MGEVMSTNDKVVGFSQDEGVDYDDSPSSSSLSQREMPLFRLFLLWLKVLRCMRGILMLIV